MLWKDALWKGALGAGLALSAVVSTATAAPSPAYRAGLKVAKSRHYERPECYARVFAVHAHLINHRKAKNFWAISDGQRFSTAVWNECQISR